MNKYFWKAELIQKKKDLINAKKNTWYFSKKYFEILESEIIELENKLNKVV